MYDIIGELNEVVTHELQHSIQNYRGGLDTDTDTDDLTDGDEIFNYKIPHDFTS